MGCHSDDHLLFHNRILHSRLALYLRFLYVSFTERTIRRKVKLTFILCFSSNSNAFYLYRATSAVCSSTPCYGHACLSKGCGYCTELFVSCITTATLTEPRNFTNSLQLGDKLIFILTKCLKFTTQIQHKNALQ